MEIGARLDGSCGVRSTSEAGSTIRSHIQVPRILIIQPVFAIEVNRCAEMREVSVMKALKRARSVDT